MDSLFEQLAEIVKPNRNAELIKELDRTTYFIIRNDGVILRNKIGDYNIYVKNRLEIELDELHKFCAKMKSKYTFHSKLVGDYKKENPSFKF